MKIAAVIIRRAGTEILERCLRSVAGWTSEIIFAVNPSLTVNKDIKNTGKRKVIYFQGGKEELLRKCREQSKADWFLILTVDEEVSIPLKIELRTRLGDIKNDSLKVKIVTEKNSIWTVKPAMQTRLYRRLSTNKMKSEGILKTPLRQYHPGKYPLAPVLSKNKIKNILIIKLRGIGDTVLLTPLLANLKKYYKNALITCLVPAASKAVLQKNPNVESVLAYDGVLDTLIELSLAPKFDLVLCPQASRTTALLARLSGAPYRVVNNHNGKNYFSTFGVAKPGEYEDAIDRDLDCLRAIGVPVKTKKVGIDLEASEVIRKCEMGFFGSTKIIGISVSASRQNKMWNKERFAELADELIKIYKYRIIFLEDPGNTAALKQVVNLMESRPQIICERSFRKVLGLIAGLDIFLGNDSGLMHTAVALGVPSVSIVGPEEARIFNPYGQKEKHITLSADLVCKPCWKRKCENPLCLEAISVKQVLEAVQKAVKL